jgi:hypothetical protein
MTLALYGKSRQRQGGLLLLGVLAVLVAMLAGVATFTSAFAHTATVTGKATCEADGTYSIAWDIKSDNSKYMFLDSVSTDAGTTNLADFVPNPVNNKGKIEGPTTAVPGNVTKVTLTAQVDWWANADRTGAHFGPSNPSGDVKLKGDCAPSLGNIQVHKYLPKDPQPASGQAPWQNQGVGQGAWTFTVYPSLADAQAGTNALASFNQLGSNSPALPQTDLWIKETGLPIGDNFYGWFIPDGDTNSGNDKCNQADLNFQSGNGYSTDPILFMPAAYWQTKGNQPGLFHICAYNKPGQVASTGQVIVKKVGKDIPAGLLSTEYSGTVTGPNHPNGTWEAVVGGVDATNSGLEPGDYQVTETSGTGSVPGGKIELVGYWEGSGDATCPTDKDKYKKDDGEVTVNQDTQTVCVMNRFKEVTRELKVCKRIENADGNANFKVVTAWGQTTKTLNATLGVSDSEDCDTYTVPQGVDITIEETEFPDGWTSAAGYPKYDLNPGGDGEMGDADGDDKPDVTIKVGNDECELVGVDVGALAQATSGGDDGPDCKVTITNKKGTPEPKGKIVVKKVKDPEAPAADGSEFTGNIDGTTSWGPITFGGSTGLIGNISVGNHSVTETGTENGWTPLGYKVYTNSSDTALCSTDPADYDDDNTAVAVAANQTTLVCVMNTKKPETITLTLRVCKLIDSDSYDTSEPFVITVTDKANFEPNITQGGEAGKLCQDYQYTLPADEPTADVTINETEPAGWDQPQYTTKDQAGSPSDPGPLPEAGVTVTLGQGTCNAESQERQIQGNGIDTPQVNPDCTVTIINNMPDPKVDVTFVKLMCGPNATIPSAFASPNPVSYDPQNIPADCFPMAGWEFYTGTSWSNSTLGGETATHTTGADGTVTHTMTQGEFDAATHAVAGNPYISYLVQEEERSPFTRGTLQCYKDYGGVNDNIEQVNFTDNAVSEDVTCIAYNRIPRVTVNFIKAICPSLGDVPSNQGANADRGGLLGAAAPAANVKVDLTNIPGDCTTVPGWQFNTGTEWNGSLGGSMASYTTVANGVPGGIAGVQHTLTGAEFMAALKDFQTTGKSYFVQEVEQSPDYLFGAIKCYADHYLDDKIERVDFEEWGLPTGDIYCIAYNVKAEREITIEKHFYTDGYLAGAGDTPEFTLYDEDYPAVTFESACEPLANGAPNHLAWTCTVPYDWDGTVTETPADGWEEVKCQERGALQQIAALVQSILAFEGQSHWEFCNAPYAEVKVQKTFVGDFAGYPAFSFTEDLPGAVSSAGPAANTTVSVYDQHVALGTYNVSEVQALTEERGCFGDGAAGYFTHVSVTKNGSTIFAKQEASGASIPVTAPGDQVTVTIYNTRCELAASPIVIVEKFADPAGNRSGTNSISGFQIAVFVDGVQLDGDLVAPGVQPFTSNGGPIVIPGLDPATITAVEVNPNTGGWMFTGSKTDIGDDGSFEKSVAGQPAAEAITYDDILRFNFYNQPRVNIEVNKTEISLATPGGAPGNGWSFTLTGCGITPQVKATGADGKATFTDLPPAVGCSYTVTETVKGGWSAINPVQVTAPTAAGQTAVLNFTNVKIEVCTDCRTILETPTPETPTATPTATPEKPTDPTATPTDEPKEEPKDEDTAGEKTPGPGQTPIAPSTGTGLLGSGPGGMNMLFALVGLLAISLGSTILALGRKSSRH